MTLDPDPSDLLPVIETGAPNQCFLHPQTCRWSCGNQCAGPLPNSSENAYFGDILQRAISRRGLFGLGALAAGFLVVGREAALGAETASAQSAGSTGLAFTPVKLDSSDRVIVPPGYRFETLIRWGDPLFLDPDSGFDIENQSGARQSRQFGYNCDWLGFIPLTETRALLVVNHEYTNPELMFPGYDPENPTRDQVEAELEAHGVSVIHIERHPARGWRYTLGAWHNRRITGTTPIRLTGPAAGHPWMRTSADPAGYTVLGTLNNCAAGITPWGTVLTCEENFHQYFANADAVTDAAKRAVHSRYGLPKAASERKWERFDPRFDLAREPSEPFRFGWVVEFDPHDPGSLPRKHTALGRFKHEAATSVIAPDGRVVLYMGDDERFEYMYRFVTEGRYNPNDREANMRLLERGTLYAARFDADGTGRWLPLVAGQGPLTAANGFATQGDVCINTRRAADLVGATKMDRPEDVETNPKNGFVYAALTNNTQRGASGRAGADAANPRNNNRHGHIIELRPARGDHTSDTFRWGIFMLCGDPATDQTYFAGFPPSLCSPISSPDNIAFDRKGNLWISTDGQTSSFKKNDGVFAVPVEGPERGYNRQFLSGVPGGEVASLIFSDTDDTLFVSIQHPGEGTTLANPSSRFPDGKDPRPSVIFVRKDDGGPIGS
ncbi:PhoX family phosphatase [Tepidiforma sp.]|uniref:PhoX family protein n=1 Tax=Tepidiforma sp. TaxID=2682230 RepID=UPI002ADD6A5A|nr:PhoX family phosphatase [Tepidiforma sp.]